MPLQVVKQDPFLTSGAGATDAPGYSEDVLRDPFLTEHATRYGATKDLKTRQDQPDLEHKFGEGIFQFLPKEYAHEGRTKRGLKQVVFGPVLVFTAALLIWSILLHVAVQLCIVLTVLMAFVCVASIARSQRLLHEIRLSPVVLGTLMLLGLALGCAAGLQGYSQHFRQTWFSFTGMQLTASAATPGGSLADAATVNFFAAGQTLNGTSVDSSRSAGFKQDGHIFCVAPVMNPKTASADMPRVNVWAIGMDCCEPFGSFTCGGSRESSAGYGVVMLDGGFPCPSCNNEFFRLAVGKAESQFGMASAPGAIYLQWTRSVSKVKWGMLLAGLLFLVVSVLLVIFTFTVLGGIVWYFGLGLSKMEKLGGLDGSGDLKNKD